MKAGKKSWYLVISLLIIIVGYMGIFCANYLSKRQGSLLTEIGKSIDYNDHFFVIESWTYCEKQELMEVCIKVDNMSFDGYDTYFTDVRARKGKNIESEVVANTRDLLVVHIANVPSNFNEIGLRIFYNDESKENPLKVYMNQEDVVHVDSIQKQTVEMYYVERNNRKIEAYEADIELNNEQIAAFSTKISNAKISVSDSKNQEGYKTQEEMAEIEKNISNIKSEIENYERQISMLEAQNVEINARIENCKKENDQLLNNSQ